MIRPITPDELHRLIQAGGADPELPGGKIHVFDLRDAAAFTAGHIPSARHLPEENNYPIRWIPQQCHTQELVILVDEDGHAGGHARHVAHGLVHKWFRRLRYLTGGFAAWRAQNLPTENGGPTGGTAASFEGTTSAVQSSAHVPWETPMDRRR